MWRAQDWIELGISDWEFPNDISRDKASRNIFGTAGNDVG